MILVTGATGRVGFHLAELLADARMPTTGQMRAAVLADGVPAWQAEGMIELFDWIRGGGCDTVTDDVRQATGEDALTLSHWLDDSRAAFLGPGLDLPLPRF